MIQSLTVLILERWKVIYIKVHSPMPNRELPDGVETCVESSSHLPSSTSSRKFLRYLLNIKWFKFRFASNISFVECFFFPFHWGTKSFIVGTQGWPVWAEGPWILWARNLRMMPITRDQRPGMKRRRSRSRPGIGW